MFKQSLRFSCLSAYADDLDQSQDLCHHLCCLMWILELITWLVLIYTPKYVYSLQSRLTGKLSCCSEDIRTVTVLFLTYILSVRYTQSVFMHQSFVSITLSSLHYFRQLHNTSYLLINHDILPQMPWWVVNCSSIRCSTQMLIVPIPAYPDPSTHIDWHFLYTAACIQARKISLNSWFLDQSIPTFT